jgi:hypothetical protein
MAGIPLFKLFGHIGRRRATLVARYKVEMIKEAMDLKLEMQKAKGFEV